MKGFNGKAVKVMNLPSAVFQDYTQFRSVSHTHTSATHSWSHKGTNGFTSKWEARTSREVAIPNRNSETGSSFRTRSAGMTLAATATASSAPITATNVSGSFSLTPHSRLRMYPDAP